MARKANFASELATISNSVDADVGRVITMLRDDEAKHSGDNGDAPPPAFRQQVPKLTSKIDTEVQGGSAQQRPANSPRRHPSPRDSFGEERILENVTTRLAREINQLLTEAALRQKLAKQTPDSRQGIIEAALTDWLERNGYVRGVEDTGGTKC